MTTTATIPMHSIEIQRPCYSMVENFKPKDSLMQELDALDSKGLSSPHVPDSYSRKQTPEPRCDIIVTSNEFVPDDDLSSIGSVEDEDAFFLFTPNSQGLDMAGRRNASPTLMDNLSSFSLTPRKNYEDPILCIPEFSPSFVSTTRSSYTCQPQQRKRGNAALDTSFCSHGVMKSYQSNTF